MNDLLLLVCVVGLISTLMQMRTIRRLRKTVRNLQSQLEVALDGLSDPAMGSYLERNFLDDSFLGPSTPERSYWHRL